MDEWLHPGDGDVAGWGDAMSFAAWDERQRALAFARILLLPNRLTAAGIWACWVDGEVAHVAATELDSIPPHNWDVMEVGAVGFRMEQALRRWTLHVSDSPRGRAFLTFEGTDECVDGTAGYEQRCRVDGTLDLPTRTLAFDGSGVRDHTWGDGCEPAVREWSVGDQQRSPSSGESGSSGGPGDGRASLPSAGTPVTTLGLELTPRWFQGGAILTVRSATP